MDRKEARIMAGVGLIVSLRDVVNVLYIGFHTYSLIRVLMVMLFFMVFIEWFLRKDEEFRVVEDLILPLCLVMAGFAIIDLSKFFSFIAIFSILRIAFFVNRLKPDRIIVIIKCLFPVISVALAAIHKTSMAINGLLIAGIALLVVIELYNLMILRRKKIY